MVLQGRYRLLSPLGEGAMGVVYLAEHMGLGKRVAVKVLRGELSRDATFCRRFELEAIAASQIGHEHIVDVTDLGRTTSGELFYVMELLEGQSLGALLRRERVLSLARAAPILAQICRALEAAHARGIIHRDVKAQNVMMVSREGRPDFVKVVDFGISKMNLPEGERLTETGAILGTADYMAPEQVSGGAVGPHTDVYAVGALAYKLLTGTPPFHGENSFATMLQHLEAKVEPPSLRRPDLGLPEALDALVLRALAKEPQVRPSMARFRVELEALASEARPLERVTGRVETSAPMTGPPAIVPVAAPERTSSSQRAWRWVMAGGVLALLGTSAWLLVHHKPPMTVTQAAPETAPPVAARPPPPTPSPSAPVQAPTPAPPLRVSIISEPPGATVSVGGRVLGMTPLELDSTEDRGPWVISLAGHAPASVERLPPSGQVDVTLKKLPAPRAPKPPASELKKVRELKPNPF
ncbi:serine/threonine-protein kinase [Myxococcus qinghaiensis]|uniref:serine/threonine-protein kinase n=1 Tax=Myxococcus qinghaiensis TaxID=2906758 RepID=UPI0020A7175D|nr:serine/threonine-protein kinase [Myxococcus qinghaiensis]